MIVVNDFSVNKDNDLEPMRSDLEEDYSNSGDAACGKKKELWRFFRGLKEDQTFLKILGPI